MPFVCEMNPIFCDLLDSGSLYRIVKKRLRWKQMDAAEIKVYLEEKFADVLATKNKGQIMKAVMADLKGKADGKVINQVVAEICK